jgi:hypothetical protein
MEEERRVGTRLENRRKKKKRKEKVRVTYR